jgi:hypothetical protein
MFFGIPCVLVVSMLVREGFSSFLKTSTICKVMQSHPNVVFVNDEFHYLGHVVGKD